MMETIVRQRCFQPSCWEYARLGRKPGNSGRSYLWRNIKVARANLRQTTTIRKYEQRCRIRHGFAMPLWRSCTKLTDIYETSIYRFKFNGEWSAGTAKQKNWSTGRRWQGRRQQHEANRERLISSRAVIKTKSGRRVRFLNRLQIGRK